MCQCYRPGHAHGPSLHEYSPLAVQKLAHWLYQDRFPRGVAPEIAAQAPGNPRSLIKVWLELLDLFDKCKLTYMQTLVKEMMCEHVSGGRAGLKIMNEGDPDFVAAGGDHPVWRQFIDDALYLYLCNRPRETLKNSFPKDAANNDFLLKWIDGFVKQSGKPTVSGIEAMAKHEEDEWVQGGGVSLLKPDPKTESARRERLPVSSTARGVATSRGQTTSNRMLIGALSGCTHYTFELPALLVLSCVRFYS